MDIVDLDKLLDDFEEDEERISVENDVSAKEFLHGSSNGTSKSYKLSIEDRDIPYPQQVSNEPPTPDSPLYNDLYHMPYKLTDSLNLSDADFGYSPKLNDLKETTIEDFKDTNSTEAFTNSDINSVSKLFQNNGVLEIRDLQINSLPNPAISNSDSFAHNYALSNISSLGSSISTDSESISNVALQEPLKNQGVEIANNSSPVPSFLNSSNNEAAIANTTSTPPESETSSLNFVNGEANQINSNGVDSNKVNVVITESLSTTESEKSISNGTAIHADGFSNYNINVIQNGDPATSESENRVNNGVDLAAIGFDNSNVNMTDEDVMAYLEESETVSSEEDDKSFQNRICDDLPNGLKPNESGSDFGFKANKEDSEMNIKPVESGCDVNIYQRETTVSNVDTNISSCPVRPEDLSKQNMENYEKFLNHQPMDTTTMDGSETSDPSKTITEEVAANSHVKQGDLSNPVLKIVPLTITNNSMECQADRQTYSQESNNTHNESAISEGAVPFSQPSLLQSQSELTNIGATNTQFIKHDSETTPSEDTIVKDTDMESSGFNKLAIAPGNTGAEIIAKTIPDAQDSSEIRSTLNTDVESSGSCLTGQADNNYPVMVINTDLDRSKINSTTHTLEADSIVRNALTSEATSSVCTAASTVIVPEMKPKEPHKMKRPSSLLGLSTVSLSVASNEAKSQSLPRSFSVGTVSNLANTDSKPICEANTVGDNVPTSEGNSEAGDNNTVNSNVPSQGQNLDLLAEVVGSNPNTTPDEISSDIDPTMQLAESRHPLPSVVIPHGQPQEVGHLPREVRPESLNLPPFLGFPSHLPDGGIEPESLDGSRLYRQTAENSDPPSYTDLENSGSDSNIGAVGGVAPSPGSSLGSVAPVWVPDAEAPNCMQCECRFTFTKRRHHCRACGKVFCSSCCSMKSKLDYLGSKEARVCVACHEGISNASSRSVTPSDRSPNPNNPSEYCSTIPPHQQVNANSPAPTVLVPIGVLKREGSHRRGEPKQVMFSDGIRPGGDLTEIDGGSEVRLPIRSGRKVHKVERSSAEGQGSRSSMKSVKVTESSRWSCLIPAVGLPPLVSPISVTQGSAIEDNPTDESLIQLLQKESAEPVVFMINLNLQCEVSIVNLDCCVHRKCWCFMSRGLCTVGQEEVVIVLEFLPEETGIPMDIFHHYQALYETASKGTTVTQMGHSIFTSTFLGNKDHGGFLYIRPSFQCLLKLNLPPPPFVVGILLQKWEIPWAKVFPIRLLLRLGAEYRYYPCPFISIRDRKPVFFEIGHTIMNLLADFRGYQYMLAQVKGVLIHMEDKKTLINFPKNRYHDLMKIVTSSNEHVMALGATFSLEADSHLVCIQNDDGNYQTQAINIQNKPRKVTGASFVVFNGALKSASGLTAKSSIVEDGLMVQISPDSMTALKQSIKDMKNYSIACGSVTSVKPDEIITIQWVEDDKSVNIGVRSPIDNMPMDGIESVHIHNGTDYQGENKVIRWTEVFFIQNKDSAKLEPIDLSRLAESLAQAGCIALTPHLDALKDASLIKIGLRATIHAESVGYEVGSNSEKLPDRYMNDLDNELIPVIHNAASLNQEGPITLELIFFVLN